MAEEHRCQPPEGHRRCANNCGFFGSAATMNLCSKCYRDHCLKERQQEQAFQSFSSSSSLSSSSSPSPVVVLDSQSPPPVAVSFSPHVQRSPTTTEDVTAVVAEQKPNRCFVCRKRVGLSGFRCRCEIMFCGTHRYPEKHSCTFDFKRIGREEIAKANPLVIAEKLHKI